jgi:hypothetical protein
MAKVPTWRWVVFIIFAILFPVALRPWWLAILSLGFFGLFVILFFPRKNDSD